MRAEGQSTGSAFCQIIQVRSSVSVYTSLTQEHVSHPLSGKRHRENARNRSRHFRVREGTQDSSTRAVVVGP